MGISEATYLFFFAGLVWSPVPVPAPGAAMVAMSYARPAMFLTTLGRIDVKGDG
jgi:hypothetical protein